MLVLALVRGFKNTRFLAFNTSMSITGWHFPSYNSDVGLTEGTNKCGGEPGNQHNESGV